MRTLVHCLSQRTVFTHAPKRLHNTDMVYEQNCIEHDSLVFAMRRDVGYGTYPVQYALPCYCPVVRPGFQMHLLLLLTAQNIV